MKLRLTAKALAFAVVVGIVSQAIATTTNGWWDIDFDDISTIAELTNETENVFSGIGTWTLAEGGKSTIGTNEINQTTCLKLDTQGGDLTWTPDNASTSSIVVINANVFLVGSETDPAGFDTDTTNPVQTAIYLKNHIDKVENETTNSVLCAYVADTESANKWIELSGDLPITDTNWYTIRIEVNYSTELPSVRFYVNDKPMAAGETDAFSIANYTEFSVPEVQQINSVSFRGTGAVDNFVGKQITATTTAAELTFTVETYTDNEKDASVNAVATPGSGIVFAGTDLKIEFPKSDNFNAGSNYLTVVHVYTNETEYIAYDVTRSSEGVWTVDPPLTNKTYTIDLVIETDGMTEGQTIKAYYGEEPTGDDPTPEGPTAPVIDGGNIGGADPIAFEMIGDDEYFCVTFAAPEAGVAYTLQTAVSLDAAFVDSIDPLATDISTEAGETITLKAPTDGATTMFFRVKAAPAPAS